MLGQVGASLGVREEPGRSLAETIAKHVGDKRLLLVLDNCEHVIDAAASVAELILRASADTGERAEQALALGDPASVAQRGCDQ